MSDLKEICVLLRKAGIGDVLTLTPGLRGLRMRYSRRLHRIQVFVPSEESRQILWHNPDVDDIEVGIPEGESVLDITEYPANYESRSIPNIAKSRIELYNEALCGFPLKDTSIVLNFTLEETDWAEKFCADYEDEGKLLIGLQAFSGEVYKDWPFEHFQELCQLIHQEFPSAVIFCLRSADQKRPTGTIPIEGELRQQCAVIAHCNLLVTPDSLLLHLGGAFQIPTLLILGPSSWRHKYSNVVVAQRQDLSCCPCIMNANLKCNPEKGKQLLPTGGLEKPLCMQELGPEQVFSQFKLLVERYETS